MVQEYHNQLRSSNLPKSQISKHYGRKAIALWQDRLNRKLSKYADSCETTINNLIKGVK